MSRFIKPENLEQLRQVDVLSYMLSHEANDLMRDGFNKYRLKSEHSCTVSPNGFFAWGRGFGGRSAIDFLTKIRGYSLIDACSIVDGTKVVEFVKPEPDKPKIFELPRANCNNDVVISYLAKRGIDREIIKTCIDRKILYQAEKFNSAVFVGHNARDEPKYAFIRGTIATSKFRNEISCSNKKYSFRVINGETPTLNVFESAIDALSFATILKSKGLDWQGQNYLALSGVYQSAQGDDEVLHKYPALKRYLDEFSNTKQVFFCFDNDRIGREASSDIKRVLEENYDVKQYFPPNVKDWNDYLKNKNLEKER
jgi:hypothetical protein